MGFAAEALKKLIIIDMPGRSFDRHPPPFSRQEQYLMEQLKAHVRHLAESIGIRNTSRPAAYRQAAEYIENCFTELGCHVNVQEYQVTGLTVRNLEVVMEGASSRPGLVLGAHYDSVDGPAANDNASGVAALLEIARLIKERGRVPKRSIHFVAFANEEPPYFYSEEMGSLVYARSLKARKIKLMGMICLETVGYYSDQPGTQLIPEILASLYSNDRGNFIGFFSNRQSRKFLKQVVGDFRAHAVVPSEGLAAPGIVPGIDFSDHWAFWECGYNAIMVTDTAFMRYPHYHLPSDTWDKLTYEPFTRVVAALAETVWNLVSQ